MKPLTTLFQEHGLSNSPTLARLVTTTFLFLPHNMTVESGFSKMKFYEKLYDGIQLTSDYFHQESREKFEILEELLRSISQANRLYVRVD